MACKEGKEGGLNVLSGKRRERRVPIRSEQRDGRNCGINREGFRNCVSVEPVAAVKKELLC